MVIVAPDSRLLNKRDEALDVVGEDRPRLGLRRSEENLIRERAQIVPLVDRVDIVSAGAKLLCDRRRVVLVEQKPQEKSSWPRRQEASARSASSRASAIHSSSSS